VVDRSITSARHWGRKALEESSLILDHEVRHLETDLLLLSAIRNQFEAGVRSTPLDRSYLYGHGNEILSEEVFQDFHSLILSRAKGVPVAYLLGHKEFYGYDFFVTEDTLIPRVETELLVEKVLEGLQPHEKVIMLDIGTGSGCIILSILSERMKQGRDLFQASSIVTGSDISHKALAVAQENARLLSCTDVHFVQGSLLDPFTFDRYDDQNVPLFLVSNPPYIDEADREVEEFVRKYEPHHALFSQDAGLAHAKKLIDNFLSICSYWKNDVHLFIEIGFAQMNELVSHLESSDLDLPEKSCGFEHFPDGSGIPRVLHFYASPVP
jgi:release factor glutamine methyltransferase